MNDLIKLLLQAEIDPKAVGAIHKQISKIADKAETIKIKIDVDDSVIKNISNINQKLQNQIKDIKAPSLDMSDMTGQLEKFTQKTERTKDGVSQLNKVVRDTSIATGESIKTTDIYNTKTGNLIKTTDELTYNYKEQRLELEKLNLYKQKMLGGDGFKGELDIFATKQKGKFDESALAKIRKDVENLNSSTPNLNNNIKSLGLQFNSLKQSAMESGGVLSRSIENMGKFLRFYLVGGVLVGFVREIKAGIDSVKELDASLTELAKVSDLSGQQLKNFTDKAYDAGKTLARTGKEVIDASTNFKRAGYEINEAFELSKQALLLTNIGDGIDNVEEASSSLIAILKGFKMEASETAHVVDALNEVSNNYAIDTVNLTEIMKRVSGTMAQTGTSYEELLGLATGGFESLRNAEMTASGLNMINQRLKGMAENGEAVEGLIPKIQKAFDRYAGGSVKIMNEQNGELNSTYSILQQLSKVYPTLSDSAKGYLNEAIAGNRKQKGGFAQKCA